MVVSIIIPVLNEQDNIKPLVSSLSKALKNIEHEIIFVDDGSTDNTAKEILKLDKNNIRLIVFSRNFGQTPAIAAGIEAAVGEYIVTIDGDLQNDPADIPRMLKKLEKENLDAVLGIRSDRKDDFILRKVPSKIANFLIRKCLSTTITDIGCTLKVLKSNVAKELDLYGEMHRFIPILANFQGARLAEVKVKHHPRKFGESKYGIGRTAKVLSDLMLLLFFQKYWQKPMHLFGKIGLLLLAIGVVINAYLLALKLLGSEIGHRPLFFVGIFSIISSFQFITTGFLAELLVRIYHNSKEERPYKISSEYINGSKIDKKRSKGNPKDQDK